MVDEKFDSGATDFVKHAFSDLLLIVSSMEINEAFWVC